MAFRRAVLLLFLRRTFIAVSHLEEIYLSTYQICATQQQTTYTDAVCAVLAMRRKARLCVLMP
jgi:hypothetical protein